MPTPSGTGRIAAVRVCTYPGVSKSTPVGTALPSGGATLRVAFANMHELRRRWLAVGADRAGETPAIGPNLTEPLMGMGGTLVGTGFITTDNTEFFLADVGIGGTYTAAESIQLFADIAMNVRHRKIVSYGPVVYAGVRYLFD